MEATQSYDNCAGFVDSLPASISTQGNWYPRGNLSTSIITGAAITISTNNLTNNVTIDCVLSLPSRVTGEETLPAHAAR